MISFKMRLSYSTIEKFKTCPRWFYLYKVKNLRIPSDMGYAIRGNIVHHALEDYYLNKGSYMEYMEDIRLEFLDAWEKSDLKKHSMLKYKREETYEMVMKGIQMCLDITDCEYKFEFRTPDYHYVGYADVMNRNTHEIKDYKTSTWRKGHSETCYREQMKYYSWAYEKDFGVTPTTELLFLKHGRSIEEKFTKEDHNEVEEEVKSISKFIDENKTEDKYPKSFGSKLLCPRFCPYKDICFGSTMKFNLEIKGNRIYIKDNLPLPVVKQLDNKFSFEADNIHWIKKSGSGWDGITRFYHRQSQSLPIGFLNPLLKTLRHWAEHNEDLFAYELKDLRVIPQECDSYIKDSQLYGITLRNYQKEAVDIFMKEKQGILNLSVGAGKTEVGAEIIRQVNGKTIWITHKKELLQQTKERLEKRLGIEVGIYQGENKDLSKQVTVAMIQSLHKILQTNSMRVQLVIVDECHHAKAKTWYKSLNKIVAPYRLGLSGSINNDKENMYIHAQLGDVIKEVTSADLMTLGYLAIPTIKMHKIYSQSTIGDWREIEVDAIINNEERNNIIRDIAINDPGFCVVIVKRIEHGEKLQEVIPNSVFINGQIKDKDREQIMKDARSGKIKCLIGTVINEGIDLPNIDTIILAGGGKSDIQTIQSAGRVLRKNVDKEKSIHDFLDDGKFIKAHSKQRMRIYNSYSNVEIIDK